MSKVGDLIIIKPNTPIWSIDLQLMVKLEVDLIGEVTNTICGTTSVFIRRKMILFNFPGAIPTMLDTNNEFGPVSASIFSSYTPPSGQVEMVYGGNK